MKCCIERLLPWIGQQKKNAYSHKFFKLSSKVNLDDFQSHTFELS